MCLIYLMITPDQIFVLIDVPHHRVPLTLPNNRPPSDFHLVNSSLFKLDKNSCILVCSLELSNCCLLNSLQRLFSKFTFKSRTQGSKNLVGLLDLIYSPIWSSQPSKRLKSSKPLICCTKLSNKNPNSPNKWIYKTKPIPSICG